MTIDIRKPLKKFVQHFIEARDAGWNEADTVKLLCRFFEQVLGYDGLEDISCEAQLKNKYIDVCLKVDGVIRLLVEAKAARQKLRDRHIEQAEMYASRNNHPWVLLTNGIDWHLYHLTFDTGIEYERAFVVTLSNNETLEKAAQNLAQLHKRAVRKGELEIFWEKTTAIGPASIAKALFNEDMLVRLRRCIRKDTGVLIDPEDLAESLRTMLLPEVREQIGQSRIHKAHNYIRKDRNTNTLATTKEKEYCSFWKPIRTEQNGLFAGKATGLGAWISKTIHGVTISLVVHGHACSVDLQFFKEDRKERRNKTLYLFPVAKYPHKLHDTPKCAYARFFVLDRGIKDRADWPKIRTKLVELGSHIYHAIANLDV